MLAIFHLDTGNLGYNFGQFLQTAMIKIKGLEINL